MKEIKSDELKKLELDILKYVSRVCKDNNFRYFLCGGTLLGAIRHKGFIPWDDDIDIFMPRSDYNKLIQFLRGNSRYLVLSPGDEGYYYNFSKIVDNNTVLVEHGYRPINNMGVYIDVFPLDGMPGGKSECYDHFKKLNKLRNKINKFSITKPTIRKNLIAYFKSWCTYFSSKESNLQKFQKAYENLALEYEYDDAKLIYASGGSYREKDIFFKSWFDDCVDVEFEGLKFNAPVNFHLYLNQLYGDYMKLPPKENQVTHHNFSAWYRY